MKPATAKGTGWWNRWGSFFFACERHETSGDRLDTTNFRDNPLILVHFKHKLPWSLAIWWTMNWAKRGRLMDISAQTCRVIVTALELVSGCFGENSKVGRQTQANTCKETVLWINIHCEHASIRRIPDLRWPWRPFFRPCEVRHFRGEFWWGLESLSCFFTDHLICVDSFFVIVVLFRFLMSLMMWMLMFDDVSQIVYCSPCDNIYGTNPTGFVGCHMAA